MLRTYVARALICGAVLAVAAAPAQASSYKVVYAFQGGSDGADPDAPLISVGGMLYGTTKWGGLSGGATSPGLGTVFSLNPTTGAKAVVYRFQGGSDGFWPQGLINVGGTLYGTTELGGASELGTVYSLNPSTGAKAVMYSFKGGSDGLGPNGGLVSIGGTLYGTTAHGGSSAIVGGAAGGGTVFSLDPTTGAETVLHSFQGGSDGALPYAGLLHVGGTLYGTTSTGGYAGQCRFFTGADGCGTVFSLKPKTGTERVVYAFKDVGSDGADPEAPLISVGGTLYGTTVGGGLSLEFGTVFSLNPTTGAETVLYSFNGHSDGSSPYAGAVKVGHKLYGTTQQGGGSGYNYGTRYGNGTVFVVDLTTGFKKVVHYFKGVGRSDGAGPAADLVNIGGTLYGTTYSGGSYGQGTVFAMRTIRRHPPEPCVRSIPSYRRRLGAASSVVGTCGS